jgi:HD-GYP domain-containing protein (c-di-GMP phosphodiesterase class II)
MSQHDELSFAAEGPPEDAPAVPVAPWKVAVIDDDESVRAITRLALGTLKVDGRPLDLLEAASAEEGIALFATHPDIALGLVDMVMEDPLAGLRLITAVREQQGNQKTRLVVRTGQPGHLPEDRIIRDYDINDYREKTELSAQKLRTVAHSAIRAFRDIHLVEEAFHGIVDLLSRVVDEKIADYLPHAVGTSEVAARLAALDGLPATRVEALRHAALLHDLGLLQLPAGVRNALLQYETLDGEARRVVLEHPMVGARLLERLGTPEGRLAARLAREHHERWDGQGYPQGLAGEAIALESRVLAVANLVDAALSPAPGRGPGDVEALRGLIEARSGGELDPRLAALALANLDLLVRAQARSRAAPA